VTRCLPTLSSRLGAVTALVWLAAACVAGAPPADSPTATLVATSAASNTASPAPVTPAVTPQPSPTAPSPPPATPTPAPPADPSLPLGFPIDPRTRLGVVTGAGGTRRLDWISGPDALTYTRGAQAGADAAAANRSGWNCRTHVEYEGAPATDWYLPVGTPLIATMSGVATLHVITVANAFDYYGLSREPYLGDPDRARAPLTPFPGPGGGKGVYIRIEGGAYSVDYAHLDLALTLPLLPPAAFLPGFSAGTDYATRFGAMRDYRDATPVARWQVSRGDVIARSGDSGYSEAAHLHYAITRGADGRTLCPTGEPGFQDGGWLLR
jgi:murein DD-endopeptidase MepM/ murein hydrolase activator NlpD